MSPAPAFLVAAGILLIASAVQSTAGFGLSLVALPLLALVLDVRTAVVGSALCGLLHPVLTASREREHVRWRVVTGVLAGAVLGMPFGLLVLTRLPERALTAAVAVVALGFTLLVWSRLRIRTGAVSVGGIGMLVGVLSTSVGLTGPPLVATFQAMGFDPESFRATLGAVFLGTSLFSVTAFVLAGQVTGPALLLGLVGLPAVALGWPLGDLAFSRLDPERFRRLVLGLLFVTSTVPLLQLVLA